VTHAAQVAAFDFDGTLSTRDNLVPFLCRAVGRRQVALASIVLAPRLVAARLDDRRRDAAKAAAVRRLLAGRDAAALRQVGEQFAAEVVDRYLRPDVAARAAWHRAEGHHVVVVSAALTPYLEPIGRTLGCATLGTGLVVDPAGRLTGELLGANVRRAEKVRRLDAWITATLGDAPVELWAYGDSTGDRELLARADHAVTVTSRPLPQPPVHTPGR
jgi:phosphatidylglycerophosphatase C